MNELSIFRVDFEANNKRSLTIDEHIEPVNKKLKSTNNTELNAIYNTNNNTQKTENLWLITNIVYEPNVNYDLCIIGTSMVKHIKVKDFIDNETINDVYLKSISGGKIKDVYDFIKAKSFKFCKYFIITCGSNDCDCYIPSNSGEKNQLIVDKSDDVSFIIKNIIDDYSLLIDYLHKTYNNSYIFVNQLIPRLRTRFLFNNFELNRIKLNTYLENLAKFDSNIVFIKHVTFETNLKNLLYDGVHIHPVNGVPKYVKEIKDVFNEVLYNNKQNFIK